MKKKTELQRATARVARLLRATKNRLVLAESCTGGLLAASITEIPGASDYFCGSTVVYRENSKQKWIGVRAKDLENFSAVSAPVAAAMAEGILRHTPEATIAGAVTGYLGPQGAEIGRIYISVRRRGDRRSQVVTFDLKKLRTRLARRDAAAVILLKLLADTLQLGSGPGIKPKRRMK